MNSNKHKAKQLYELIHKISRDDSVIKEEEIPAIENLLSSMETESVAEGTSDHTQLINRNVADQHPIDAVTGLRSELDSKQENLSSGQNIKTVNNQSLLGSGNISITGEGVDFVDVSDGDTYILVQGEIIPVTNLTLNPSNLVLNVGAEQTIAPVITPANATNKRVVWQSANPQIATVNAGTVQGVATGSTTIKATSTDGTNITATANITVSDDAPQPSAKLIAHYDFSLYPNGYTGEIEDLSGCGNVPTVTGLEGYTSGRNGIIGGKLMINDHKVTKTSISLPLPATLDVPDVMSLEVYAHLRKGYNQYAVNGALDLGTPSTPQLYASLVYYVYNNINRMGIVENQMQVVGQLNNPSAVQDLPTPIVIDGYTSPEITNNKHHIVFTFSPDRYVGYLNGVKIVEAPGKSYNYQGGRIDFFHIMLKADVYCIKIHNNQLSDSDVSASYQEMLTKYNY